MEVIYPDADFNSRKVMEGVEALSVTMKRDGQLTPMLVTKAVIGKGEGKGKHLLIAGYRRYAAAQLLGWKEVAVQLVDVEPYSKAASILNLQENLARHDLTTFDVARSITGLMETHHMSDKQVAETFRASLTIGYKQVNNLVQCVKRLHPDILVAWKEQNPLATTVTLFSLYKFDPDKQVELWNQLAASKSLPGLAEFSKLSEAERKVAEEKAKAEQKAKREAKRAEILAAHGGTMPPKVHKPGDAERAIAFKLVAETEGIADEIKSAVLSVLGWVEGKNPTLTISGKLVYDPKAEKERSEKQKLQEKQAASVAKRAESMTAEERREMLAKLAAMEAEERAKSEGTPKAS